MKKILTICLLAFVLLLTSCAAESDMMEPQDPMGNINDDLYYNYYNGTFNNTVSSSILYGVHDYQIEFTYMYQILVSKYNYPVLTENQTNAYNSFLKKLESLDMHNHSLFTMDSDELKNLFNAVDTELTALDIFSFIAIKELFDELYIYRIEIDTIDYLELFKEESYSAQEREDIANTLEFYNDYLLGSTLSYDIIIETITNLELERTDEELNQLERGVTLIIEIIEK